MQKTLAKPSRIALGITVLGALTLGGLGCGSSPGHPNSDAGDAKKETATGAAGTDGGAGATNFKNETLVKAIQHSDVSQNMINVLLGANMSITVNDLKLAYKTNRKRGTAFCIIEKL